jgi:hypothetical protein
MRVILYPNGAVVNNVLEIELIPGTTVSTKISIPGYVAGSFSIITDLNYTYDVVADTLLIDIFVPPSYSEGMTSLVVSYGTINISGYLHYTYDIISDVASRTVTITNNSGSAFMSEIAVAEGDDIYTAVEVDYGIVGTLEVNEGTQTYPLQANISTSVFFNIFPYTMDVSLVVEMLIDEQQPLPGTLTILSDSTEMDVPVMSSTTILSAPYGMVEVQRVEDTDQFVIGVRDISLIRVVIAGNRTLVRTDTYQQVPFTQEQGAILFSAQPGTYLLK